MMRRWTAGLAAGVLVAGAMCSVPSVANAFLLLGKGKDAPAKQTSVAVLREDRDTVLSIAVRLRDDTTEVVMLVPVPGDTDKSILPFEVFDPLSRVTVPRVDEYWEADPCEFHSPTAPPVIPDSPPGAPAGSSSAGPKAGPGSSAAPSASSAPSASPSASPSSEAKPRDYEISFFSGKAGELVESLKKDGYTLPADLEPTLAKYLDAGMKIAVAKIDAQKATSLPPLRLHYVADDLVLPTRLFALAPKTPLEVYMLAPYRRFEAKDQPNIGVPTNLDVGAAARPKLSKFYGALIDETFKKKPGSVITEYAWRASTCEGCKAPLSAAEVGSFGLTLLPSAKAGKQQEIVIDADQVSHKPGGPDGLRAALEACYAKAISSSPGLGGDVTVDVEVANGAVTSAKVDGTADAALGGCVVSSAKATPLEKSGAIKVSFIPVSRQYFSELVLTKLRARFDKMPEKDLTLRAAKAIEGGRELGPDGKPEKKVYWATSGNDFQPRYAIRHAFKGKIRCENPEREFWGGPPEGWKPDPSPSGDGIDLVKGGLPGLDAYAIEFQEPAPIPAPTPPPPAPSSVPSAGPAAPSAVPSAGPAPSGQPADDSSGCGCSVADTSSERSSLLAGLSLLGMSIARRRRRARRADATS